MLILIVDDSPDARAIAKARLSREGHDILCANGGKAGLEKVKSKKPDLILLDVEMPGLSGFDVCRALKADAETAMIPVIFLTGSENTNDKVKGLDVGAVDYVTKPFDDVELRARVRAALRTKRLQDLLVKYTQIDPLTEIWNRRTLDERLQQEWARIQRQGGSLSFVMTDIDRFKEFNDVYGHPMGDKMLREVAKVFSTHCRESDLPARYGGDEFAILIPGEDAEAARKLVKRCQREIEKISLPGQDDTHVTASFGVADSNDANSRDALIEKADSALYEAKRNGRNRMVLSSPPPDDVETSPPPQQSEVGK